MSNVTHPITEHAEAICLWSAAERLHAGSWWSPDYFDQSLHLTSCSHSPFHLLFFFFCLFSLFPVERFIYFLFIRNTNRLCMKTLLSSPKCVCACVCVCDSVRTFTFYTLCSGLTWPLTENRFSPLEMEVMCGDGETSHCWHCVMPSINQERRKDKSLA